MRKNGCRNINGNRIKLRCILMSMLLTIIMSVPVYAAEQLLGATSSTARVIQSSTCGDGVSYTLYDTDGDNQGDYLVIAGNGRIKDNAFPWSKITSSNMNKYLKKVTIKDGVTAIGDYAFSWCSGLTTVTIPSSVTSIGKYAFASCYKLQSLTIPNSVRSIGDHAFFYCSNLTSISIPYGVSAIEKSTFSGCYALASVSIPASVKSIENRAFDECHSLNNVTIPSGVTLIDDYAFSKCNSLTAITVPGSVRSIGNNAFFYCTSLTSVEIMDGVQSIGDYAFTYCYSISELRLPTQMTYIGQCAFSVCDSLTSVVVPRGIRELNMGVFSRCDLLADVTLPDDLESIGEVAFSYGRRLTSIVLPEGLKYIGRGAFSNCMVLTDAVIPDSVVEVDEGAFYGCSSLTSMVIGNSVNIIGPDAFCSCPKLMSLQVPESVRSIGNGAIGMIYSARTYTNIDGFVLYGKAGSAAQTYANKNGISFSTSYAPCTLLGYDMILNGSCDLRYTVKVNSTIKNTKGTYVEFSYGGMVSQVSPINNSDGTQTYICKVASKYMNERIKATLVSGGQRYSLSTYSVKDYLNSLIANKDNRDTYTPVSNLATAMLNYGSYSQLYFNYNTDRLANAGMNISSEVTSISDDYIRRNVTETFKGTQSNTNLEYYGATLTCESDIELNIYFKNKNGLSLDALKNKYAIGILGVDSSRVGVKLSDGFLILTLKDIPAAELSNVYTFNIKNGTDSIAITYSPMDYIRKSMSQSNENLKNLCKSLYLYNIESKKYFN